MKQHRALKDAPVKYTMKIKYGTVFTYFVACCQWHYMGVEEKKK